MEKELDTFATGDKIKDVKINERQHFLLFVSVLLLFNVLLLASTIFVLVFLTKWYNWLMCIVIWVICAWFSFKAYRDEKNYHKCAIYNNAIVVNSIWFNIVVDFKNIYDIKIKESNLDKMFNTNTHSMTLYLINGKRKKFTIHFIEEDVEELKNEILTLITDKIENKKQV